MEKKVTLKIKNTSSVEAFDVEGINLERGSEQELTVPMTKANKIVAAVSGIESINVSVVPESLQDAAVGFGQEALQEAQELVVQLKGEVVALSATVNDQQSVIDTQAKKIAELEALIEAQAKKITEQEALIEAQKPTETKTEVKAEVKTEAETQAAPAKTTAAKKTAK